MATLTVAYETVTPEKAAAYLETMERRKAKDDKRSNRTLRQHKVDYYAGQMVKGLWRVTHQGIAFDEEGCLVDGQHRMWAIIETGLSQKMQATRGLTDDDVIALDQGMLRTNEDVAHYQGWDIDPMALTVAKWLVLGVANVTRPIPPDVLHSWYEFYHEGIDCALAFRAAAMPMRKKLTAPMTAAVARAYYELELKTLDRFAEILKTGQKEYEVENAAVVFRDAWLAGRLGLPSEQYYKMQGALRAFNERRAIRTLQKPESDIFQISRLPKELRYEPRSKGTEKTRREAREQKRAQLVARP